MRSLRTVIPAWGRRGSRRARGRASEPEAEAHAKAEHETERNARRDGAASEPHHHTLSPARRIHEQCGANPKSKTTEEKKDRRSANRLEGRRGPEERPQDARGGPRRSSARTPSPIRQHSGWGPRSSKSPIRPRGAQRRARRSSEQREPPIERSEPARRGAERRARQWSEATQPHHRLPECARPEFEQHRAAHTRTRREGARQSDTT